jgi:hypothetical protein
MSMEDRRAGWTSDSRRPVAVIEFQYPSDAEPETEETDQPDAPDILMRVLDTALGSRPTPRGVGLRLIALASLVAHPALGGRPLAEIARANKVSKQRLYHIALELSEQLGIPCRWQRKKPRLAARAESNIESHE